MNELPNELESRLESLTTWPAEHDPTLWESALQQSKQPRTGEPWTLRIAPKHMAGIAATVTIAAVGVWVSMGMLGQARSAAPVMSYDRSGASSEMEHAVAHPFQASGHAFITGQDIRAFEIEPRAIQRSAAMECTTDSIRPLFDRVTALVDAGLGEFVENASAYGDRAEATLRVSAQRLNAVMRSIRELDGVAEVVREELSAVDATDRQADLTARLANERRIEVELLELIDKRPDAPLADVLRVREALSEVRLNIERLDAQRSTLNERVALATLRVSIVQIDEEEQPEPDASGFLHDLGDAFTRGGQTLADSASWIVEALVGGLIAWVVLVVAVVWAYRAARWRATWA
ncbi:MAG: DUF4349 domain-containing protein [Phycisphaera sp.]|nr:MAG: DUF4349 domain-containing protein [Phycisphaera sp.]